MNQPADVYLEPGSPGRSTLKPSPRSGGRRPRKRGARSAHIRPPLGAALNGCGAAAKAGGQRAQSARGHPPGLRWRGGRHGAVTVVYWFLPIAANLVPIAAAY